MNYEDKEIPAEAVFVIELYDAGYQSDRVSTLLVNKDLKAEYDTILKSIQENQDAFIAKSKERQASVQALKKFSWLSYRKSRTTCLGLLTAFGLN